MFTLAARAVKAAVADAGLELRDVDGLCTYGVNDSIPPNILAQAIGIEPELLRRPVLRRERVADDARAGRARVSAGVADCVVCYRALNGRSEVRLNGGGAARMRLPWDMPFKMAGGVMAPSQEIAMAARAHMLKYGTTNEDFGRIAVLSRTNALDNERAMMRKPMTMDDYLASRWIVEPFRMFDCCLETDGAVAVVVVSADRAKDLPHRPVLIQGAAWGGGVTVVNNGHTDLAESPARLIAPRLFDAAGIGPDDVEFAELYDCFTYNVLSQIEGYGFAGAGHRRWAMLADGAFDRATGSLRSTRTAACSRRATSTG